MILDLFLQLFMLKKQRIIRKIHRFKFNISVKRNEKGVFRLKIKKNTSSNINLFISLVYHPNEIEDQEIFN